MQQTQECLKCKEEFIAYNEFQKCFSDQGKEEALADLDKGSDECLSCQ